MPELSPEDKCGGREISTAREEGEAGWGKSKSSFQDHRPPGWTERRGFSRGCS